MDVATIRTALDERLRDLEAALGDLTAVPRDPMGSVSFGKRIGEGTTEAVDRLAKVGAAEQLEAMRTDVVRALAKLDDGTYGSCDRCDDAIASERLEARPWSVLCVRCASAA